VKAEYDGLLRSVMRGLLASCPKLKFLQLTGFYCRLGDEDLLGVDDEGGLPTTATPPGK
jgi:hypothetical protein